MLYRESLSSWKKLKPKNNLGMLYIFLLSFLCFFSWSSTKIEPMPSKSLFKWRPLHPTTFQPAPLWVHRNKLFWGTMPRKWVGYKSHLHKISIFMLWNVWPVFQSSISYLFSLAYSIAYVCQNIWRNTTE